MSNLENYMKQQAIFCEQNDSIWLSEKIGAQKIKSYTDQEILESLSLVRGPLACATFFRSTLGKYKFPLLRISSAKYNISA